MKNGISDVLVCPINQLLDKWQSKLIYWYFDELINGSFFVRFEQLVSCFFHHVRNFFFSYLVTDLYSFGGESLHYYLYSAPCLLV